MLCNVVETRATGCRVDLMSGLKRIQMIDRFCGNFVWAKVQERSSAAPTLSHAVLPSTPMCKVRYLCHFAAGTILVSRSLTHSLSDPGVEGQETYSSASRQGTDNSII